MCFGALAPTVSKWLAATPGGLTWVQVCSVNGPESIAISTAPDKSQAPALGDEYCPYCALVHHLPFVPPAQPAFVPDVAARTLAYAGAAPEVPRAHETRRAHAPRAPPAFS